MNTNDVILITGATGQQGGAVARALLKQGQRVRAFTRNPAKAEDLRKLGAEIAVGELTDRASLIAALKGVKKMFLVTTPYEKGTEFETEQGITAADAAQAAGIEYLFFSSVGSAQRHTGIPHFESKRRVEEHIEKLGIPNTFLRPAFFMENFGSPWFLPGLQSGTFALPMPVNCKLAMVTLSHIGDLSARALLNPQQFVGDRIELASDDVTIPDAVAMISKAAGKTIAYQALPHEGADKIFGPDFAMMFKWFDDVGYNPDFATLEKKYGLKLVRFGDYLKTAPWIKQV